MNTNTILKTYHHHNDITDEIVNFIQDDRELRVEMVNHFRSCKDHEFAIALLKHFIAIRKAEKPGIMPFENLMFACYLLTLHHDIKDCLLIWDAKYADFDTYCGLDMQLVVFAGVTETIKFLATQTTETAGKALNYIKDYGDFDDLNEYFLNNTLPWFV